MVLFAFLCPVCELILFNFVFEPIIKPENTLHLIEFNSFTLNWYSKKASIEWIPNLEKRYADKYNNCPSPMNQIQEIHWGKNDSNAINRWMHHSFDLFRIFNSWNISVQLSIGHFRTILMFLVNWIGNWMNKNNEQTLYPFFVKWWTSFIVYRPFDGFFLSVFILLSADEIWFEFCVKVLNCSNIYVF